MEALLQVAVSTLNSNAKISINRGRPVIPDAAQRSWIITFDTPLGDVLPLQIATVNMITPAVQVYTTLDTISMYTFIYTLRVLHCCHDEMISIAV